MSRSVFSIPTVLALFVIFIMAAPPSAADVLFVDADIPASGDGSSWAEAKKTLGEAVAAAQMADEVWIAAATYTESVTMTVGLSLYGGFDGTEILRSQRDPLTNRTIIDAATAAGGAPGLHVFKIADVTAPIVLDGLLMTGGDGVSGPFFDRLGGAIHFVRSATLTLEHCTLKGNRSEGGGALYMHTSRAIIRNCTFTDNTAATSIGQGVGGGAIHAFSSCEIDIIDCLFENNQTGGQGGAIFASLGIRLRVDSTRFSKNLSGHQGGAIFLQSPNPGSYFRDSVFVDNRTTDETGGALFLDSHEDDFNVYYCTFEDNAAELSAGAVYVDEGDPTFEDCRFISNFSKAHGGAMYIDENVNLDRCSFVTNSCLGSGGAILFTFSSGGNIRECIFNNNYASDDSGAVQCNGELTFESCQFVGNEAQYGMGGAVTSRNLTIFNNCLFAGNHSFEAGPAIACSQAELHVINCTVLGNSLDSAAVGGAIGADPAGNTSALLLRNTIFQNNSYLAISARTHSHNDIIQGCLFHNNPDGVYLEIDTATTYTTAAEINANLNHPQDNTVVENRDGDALFTAQHTGQWTEDPNPVSGSWQTVLTDANANYAPDSLVGLILLSDTQGRDYRMIVENTATTIVVEGINVIYYASAGDSYRILDGAVPVSSPAVDNGVALGAARDYAGNIRPIDSIGYGKDRVGPAYDIGMFEIQDRFDPGPTTSYPERKLLIADEENSSVVYFDPETGARVSDFIVPGSPGLDQPRGMSIDLDGNILVASLHGNRVLRFDGETGAFMEVVAELDGTGYANPFAAVQAHDGDIYVNADNDEGYFANQHLLRFDGETGTLLDALDILFGNQARGMDMDYNGVLYAASTANVASYDPATQTLDPLFYFGYDNQDLYLSPDGRMFMPDYSQEEVAIYHAINKESIWPVQDTRIYQPRGATFLGDGSLLVSNTGDGRILRYWPDTGDFVEEFISPSAGVTLPGCLLTAPAWPFPAGSFADNWRHYR